MATPGIVLLASRVLQLACVLLLTWAAPGPLAPGAHAETGPAAVEVVICASHHRVLAQWLRAAREGILPGSGVRIVHVDAHPDLAVPRRPLPEPGARDPDRLLRSVDISSFQLAAVHAGLVERIVWLRPDFSDQLPDGERAFQLGLTESGLLRVDDPSDYYVLDQGWAASEALSHPVRVRLQVLPLRGADRALTPSQRPTVLDIDLDAFATRNPAADRLRQAGLNDRALEALRRIFSPENLDLAADPATRIAQLEALLRSVGALAAGSPGDWPAALWTLWRRGLTPGELYRLYDILGSLPDGIAIDGLLRDGRELVGLPEHIEVSAEEIETSARAIGDLLRSGAVRPALVTIARSVGDGFTPRPAWPLIEWSLLRELAASLGPLRIRFDAGLRPAPRP